VVCFKLLFEYAYGLYRKKNCWRNIYLCFLHNWISIENKKKNESGVWHNNYSLNESLTLSCQVGIILGNPANFIAKINLLILKEKTNQIKTFFEVIYDIIKVRTSINGERTQNYL
jgi:hypothetical protein